MSLPPDGELLLGSLKEDKMVTLTKQKTETLVERFNKYLDDYIADLEFVPALNDSHRRSLLARPDTLRLVKTAFNHFVKEIGE